MAEKPENEGMRPARNKPKATPAIDLPATDVIEVKAEHSVQVEAPAEAGPAIEAVTAEVNAAQVEPVVEPNAPAQPAAPATKPSKLVPGLIGLVAGAIGGFGAYHLGEFSRVKTPPMESALVTRLGALEQRIATAKPGDASTAAPKALMDRLEKAEALLVEAGTREAALRTELGKVGAAVSAETAERKKALETLSQRPAPAVVAGGTPAAGNAELDGLKSRLGSVETLQPKLDTVTKDLQDLSGKIAALNTRDPLGAANARLAAVNLLEDGFARGRPLVPTLELLKNLGSDAALLAAFAPFAAAGAPDAKKLHDELRAIAPPPAANAAPPDQGLIDRVKQGALSLVEVRRTGDVTGSDDAAHLARAGQALQRGEIGAALVLVARLSPAAAPAHAGWRTRAEARLKAVEALTALRGEAVAALAKAASAAK
jgi:hypothetical protein